MSTKEDRIEELVSLYSVGAISGEELRELEKYMAEDRDKVEALMKESNDAASLLSFNTSEETPPPYVKDQLLRRIKLRKSFDDDKRKDSVVNKFLPLIYGFAGAGLAVLLVFIFNGYMSGISRAKYEALNTTAQQQKKRIASLEKEVASRNETINQLKDKEGRLNTRLAGLDEQVKNSREKVDDLTTRLDNVNKTVDSMKSKIASKDDQLSKYMDLVDYLRDPDVVVIDLSNLKTNLNSLGRVLWNKQQDSGLFYGLNLPSTPKDKVYQLWAIIGSKPVSCGIFNVDSEGNGKVRITNLEDSSDIKKFAVTLEPAGGVPSPTGEMYLAGAISD